MFLGVPKSTPVAIDSSLDLSRGLRVRCPFDPLIFPSSMKGSLVSGKHVHCDR